MTDFRRFDLKTLDDLRGDLEALGLELPISGNLAVLGEKVGVGNHELPNRFVIQPMEGVDGEPDTGAPSRLTYRRYRRFAEGGSGLIWAEAVAVAPEGCSNAKQMRINEDNLDHYKQLVSETKAAARESCGHEVKFVIQLTHSGRFSRPGGAVKPLKVQHNPFLDGKLGMADLEPVSDDYLDGLQDQFVRAATLAAEAGFDGVDMKAVHGYLIAELLGAHTREGKYGGSYENRTRFLRETALRMMDELPKSTFVTSRTTVLEPCPYPYGWGVVPEAGEEWKVDLSEPKRLMKECFEMGMPMFNVSVGFPRFQPYLNRPHDNSLMGENKPPEYPLVGVERFQQTVREMQQSLPECPVPTAGLAWLRHLLPEVAAGLVEAGWCSLIGLGRGAFAYPELVKDILGEGKMDPAKCCTTCSMCSQIMKDGVGCGGCVVRDKEIYGPELKKGRAAAKAKGLA
ncbi:NADH:flavin oxidoreductase [Pontiella sp.]|uniref:oxidoreductase n=1 Tax=Pontiella sp. TaxID=2837462 RepID=UPI003561D91F